MEKLIKKNNQLIYIALLLFILLVFSAIGNSFKKDIIVELFGQKIENTKSKNIFVEKSEAYISLEALKKYIDAGAYYDKISKTCTITSGSQILKMELGASEASLNYEKIKVNQAVIRKGNEIYIPFSSIEKIYKIEGLISKNKKNVYIASSNIEQITLKNSNVNVYTKADIRNISKDKLNKKDKVFAYYTSTSSDWVLIKSEKEVVGYIGKYNLSQDSIKNIDLKTKELENKELSEKESAKTLKLNGVVSTLDYKVSSVYKENNIKNVFVNMFEVLKTNGELDSVPIASVALNILKNSGNKVYGNISNAYNSSNFDNTVIPNVIKNQDTRDILIKNITKETVKYKLDGIVINFENIKKVDEEIYVQFLKEVSTAMKSIDKKIFVYGTSDLDISKALYYIDYYIIKGYNSRDVYSNISSNSSDINTIKSNIDTILNINKGQYASKTIIELPLFSILWEEKNSVVQTAKIYSGAEAEKYIKDNKLKKVLDKNMNQNYIEMTKGIISYKMWVEDEYSIKAKMELIKKNNLAGVILYKSGYENTADINKIFK